MRSSIRNMSVIKPLAQIEALDDEERLWIVVNFISPLEVTHLMDRFAFSRKIRAPWNSIMVFAVLFDGDESLSLPPGVKDSFDHQIVVFNLREPAAPLAVLVEMINSIRAWLFLDDKNLAFIYAPEATNPVVLTALIAIKFSFAVIEDDKITTQEKVVSTLGKMCMISNTGRVHDKYLSTVWNMQIHDQVVSNSWFVLQRISMINIGLSLESVKVEIFQVTHGKIRDGKVPCRIKPDVAKLNNRRSSVLGFSMSSRLSSIPKDHKDHVKTGSSGYLTSCVALQQYSYKTALSPSDFNVQIDNDTINISTNERKVISGDFIVTLTMSAPLPETPRSQSHWGNILKSHRGPSRRVSHTMEITFMLHTGIFNNGVMQLTKDNVYATDLTMSRISDNLFIQLIAKEVETFPVLIPTPTTSIEKLDSQKSEKSKGWKISKVFKKKKVHSPVIDEIPAKSKTKSKVKPALALFRGGCRKELLRRHIVGINTGVYEMLQATGYSGDEIELALKVTRNNHWNTLQFISHYEMKDDHDTDKSVSAVSDCQEERMVSVKGIPPGPPPRRKCIPRLKLGRLGAAVPPGPPPRSKYAFVWKPKPGRPGAAVPPGPPPRKKAQPKKLPSKLPPFKKKPSKDLNPLGRKIFWKPLATTQGTVFHGIKVIHAPLQVDEEKLKLAFSKGNKVAKNSVLAAPRTVISEMPLFSSQRAQNVSIMLARLGDIDTLASRIRDLDMSISHDILERFEKVIPTEDESDLLESFLAQPRTRPLRRSPEQIVLPLRLSQFPAALPATLLLKYLQTTRIRCRDFQESLRILETASNEIVNSERFRHILFSVLRWGNFVNHGINEGEDFRTQGFTLESLLKICSFRSQVDSNVTSLHYIAINMITTSPEVELEKLPSDMPTITAAANLSREVLSSKLSDMNKCRHHLKNAQQNKLLTSLPNYNTVTDDLKQSLSQCSEISKQYAKTMHSIWETSTFFGHVCDTVGDFKPEEFFSVLHNFLTSFNNVIKDIQVQTDKFAHLALNERALYDLKLVQKKKRKKPAKVKTQEGFLIPETPKQCVTKEAHTKELKIPDNDPATSDTEGMVDQVTTLSIDAPAEISITEEVTPENSAEVSQDDVLKNSIRVLERNKEDIVQHINRPSTQVMLLAPIAPVSRPVRHSVKIKTSDLYSCSR